ncbi:hypothetical protein MMC28_011159 [Mycoblastus sanguinarius]|nr:hypothetical protein [Mycoblastus sanguinarius]
MFILFEILASALALISCIQAAPQLAPSPSSTSSVSDDRGSHSACRNLTFTVHASAVNKVIPSPAAGSLSTQDGVNAFYAGLPNLLAAATNQTRNGTYQLAAVYCQPRALEKGEVVAQNAPLQILLHGSTYTKEYWDRGSWGYGDPKYSWTKAMNYNGYATLAVDKLGNGASSHPDPVYDVQLPLQMETIHTLITQIKAGTASIPVPKKIIFVSHSSGSILNADLVQTHPNDVDAVVLTGYPAGGANNKGGIPSYHYLPASLSAPTRFPDLNYGYLFMNSEFNRTSAFYYVGHYDPEIPRLDYLTAGSVPLGEGFTLGPATQPAFQGKVLVVTGQKDPAICGFTPVDQCAYNNTPVLGVNTAFSSNTGFDYYMPPTGHDLNWHYTAPQTYEIVVQKLGALIGFNANVMG